MQIGTVSKQLADFIHDTSFEDLPPQVVEQAKSRVLDCLSTAIAARGLPIPQLALRFVEANRGEATIFGSELRVPGIDAALVNATLVNGRSQDDYLEKSHPSALTIPAAAAIAEEEHSSGKEFLTGIVLGYEIVARTYMGGPAMLPKFRASGVAGAVGAAATAGKLLKLPVPQLMNALGYSAMFASGFGEGFLSGTMEVKFNVGWACRSGVTAAMLARLGATASPTAFEGESGFFRAFAGTVEHAEAATRDLGKRFLMTNVVYKECPVCLFVQTPIHLGKTLAQERNIDPNKIKRVSVLAPEAAYTNPGYRNVAPYRTNLQARVSARFCTAAALLRKPVESHDFYEQSRSDPQILALAEKIDLVEPTNDTERVALEVIHDGERLYMTATQAETMRPTMDKIVSKFRRLTADFLGKRTDQVIDTVLGLERIKNIRELTDQLRFKDQ